MGNKPMNFGDIIKGLQEGRFREGDVFINSEGFKITVYNESLCWLAGISEYVSEKVALDPEVYGVEWKVDRAVDALTLGQAVDKILDGQAVTFDTGDEVFEIDNISDLDAWVYEDYELVELAVSRIRPAKEKKPKQETHFNTVLSGAVATMSEGIREAMQGITYRANQSPEKDVDVAVEIFKDSKSSDRYSKKLTKSEAWDIHYLRKMKDHSVAELSDMFGVTERMIYYVLDGTHWGDVKRQFTASE